MNRNDVFVTCEAANLSRMVFAQLRSIEQSSMILEHRLTERLVGQCTTLINQLWGLLQEYGIVLIQGKEKLRNQARRGDQAAGVRFSLRPGWKRLCQQNRHDIRMQFYLTS